MDAPLLNTEKDFLVRESSVTNYVVGAIFIVIFVVSMAMGDYGWANFLYAIGLFLLPGLFAIVRARNNEVIIKINKNGIYYRRRLITAWSSFVDATLTQDEIPGDLKDNFIILVRYYGSDFQLYEVKIRLTDTQDKGDEEVLQAIASYSGYHIENSREENMHA
jgi:hypothetical protein